MPKPQKAALFVIVRRSFMEESWFGFWKAKETALLKKRQKSAFSKAGKDKGEGKPTLSMRWFPLSLFIYPKLCSFASAPKNAVHFLYGAAFHRPGELPWTPVRRAFLI